MSFAGTDSSNSQPSVPDWYSLVMGVASLSTRRLRMLGRRQTRDVRNLEDGCVIGRRWMTSLMDHSLRKLENLVLEEG